MDDTVQFQVAAAYPGLLVVPVGQLFGRLPQRGALHRLRAAAVSSYKAAMSAASTAQGPKATDVAWARVRGGRSDHDNKAHWEVTLPRRGLCQEYGQLLAHRAPISTQRRRVSRTAGKHYDELQQSSDLLAEHILQFWRDKGAAITDTTFHIATQLAVSNAGAERARHKDPEPIAAALATMSLTGAASITVDSEAAREEAVVLCNGTHVYMLTGEASASPAKPTQRIHHAVCTTEGPRLAVTFRFADSSITWGGSSAY